MSIRLIANKKKGKRKGQTAQGASGAEGKRGQSEARAQGSSAPLAGDSNARRDPSQVGPPPRRMAGGAPAARTLLKAFI